MAPPNSGNLDRLLFTAIAEHDGSLSVGALVSAALAEYSDSYTRTRIRELTARGLLNQEETGGPVRLTTAGREALAGLHGREESEATA